MNSYYTEKIKHFNQKSNFISSLPDVQVSVDVHAAPVCAIFAMFRSHVLPVFVFNIPQPAVTVVTQYPYF